MAENKFLPVQASSIQTNSSLYGIPPASEVSYPASGQSFSENETVGSLFGHSVTTTDTTPSMLGPVYTAPTNYSMGNIVQAEQPLQTLERDFPQHKEVLQALRDYEPSRSMGPQAAGYVNAQRFTDPPPPPSVQSDDSTSSTSTVPGDASGFPSIGLSLDELKSAVPEVDEIPDDIIRHTLNSMVHEPPVVSMPRAIAPLNENPPPRTPRTNTGAHGGATSKGGRGRPVPAPRSFVPKPKPGQQYKPEHQPQHLRQLQKESDRQAERLRQQGAVAAFRQDGDHGMQRRSTEELERPMRIGTRAEASAYRTNKSEASTYQMRPRPEPPSNIEKAQANQAARLPPSAANTGDGVNNDNKYQTALQSANNDGQPISPKNAQAMAVDEREARNKVRVLLQSGKLKERNGKHMEAVKDFQEAIKYEKIAHGANSEQVAKTLTVLGKLYHKMGRNNEARIELEKSLDMLRTIGYTPEANPDDFWSVHDSLAQVYDSLKNHKKEIENYETAIRILVQSTNVPPERLPHMHNNVGNAYRASGNLNKALEHLEKSKEMMMMMHFGEAVEDMAKVHSSLGDVYHDLGRLQDAATELEECIRIRQKTRPGPEGTLIRGGTHRTLVTLYEALGNEEKVKYHKEKSQVGLKGIMGSKEERDSLLQQLGAEMNGVSGPQVLGKLAAGITASEDINKAQQYQAENNSVAAIQHYEKGIASLMELPSDIRNQEELLSTLALCHNNVGNAYRKTNQFPKAEQHLTKALEIRRRLFADEATDDTASTLFNLGHLLQGIGGRQNTQKAIEYHEECLKMYMDLGGPDLHMNWIISLYRSLGVGYERLGNSRQSIDNYEQAKAILVEKAGDLDELRAVCNNMGNSYESIGDYKKAEENIQTALNLSLVLSEERPNDVDLQNHIAAGYNNLGVLYQTWGKLDLALENLYRSKDLREKIKDVNMEAAHDVASSYHNIGNTLIKMGDLQGAYDIYLKELKIRRDLGEDTSGVRVAMSNVCEKLGDMDKAEKLLNDTFVPE